MSLKANMALFGGAADGPSPRTKKQKPGELIKLVEENDPGTTEVDFSGSTIFALKSAALTEQVRSRPPWAPPVVGTADASAEDHVRLSPSLCARAGRSSARR